jgi:hypothetical protein
MATSARWAAFVSISLFSICGGEDEPRFSTVLPEPLAVHQPDGKRIGSLLHDRGLIQNPEVFARAQEAALASHRGTAAGDSTSRAFRTWLEEWVTKNPDRVVEAEDVHSRATTLVQQAEQHRQVEMERRQRAVKALGAVHGTTPR